MRRGEEEQSMFMGRKPAPEGQKEKKGLFRSSKPKQKTQEVVSSTVQVGEGHNHLWLMLHGGGWEWIVQDANGVTLTSGRAEASSQSTGETNEAIFKAATRDLSHEKDIAKDLRDIVLLIEDPGIVSLDGKNTLVHQQSERTLRDVGGQLLGVKKAAFGRQVLGHDSDTATVYTFGDAEQLSRRLGNLDILAPAVTALVPLGNVLLHHAATHAGGGRGRVHDCILQHPLPCRRGRSRPWRHRRPLHSRWHEGPGGGRGDSQWFAGS